VLQRSLHYTAMGGTVLLSYNKPIVQFFERRGEERCGVCLQGHDFLHGNLQTVSSKTILAKVNQKKRNED